MNQDQVIRMLKRRIKQAKGLRKFARDWGICASIVCDCVNGRREPGGKLLEILGLEKQTIYKKIKGETQ